MSYETKYPDWKDQIVIASVNSDSASGAAAILGIKYDTYKKYAIKYGCFVTNQSGKGTIKPSPLLRKFQTEDILKGKCPEMLRKDVKKRMVSEGHLENKCYECGITDWNSKPLVCHLEHINGISNDHRLENLTMLCPNCHSQTSTYAGKNRKDY